MVKIGFKLTKEKDWKNFQIIADKHEEYFENIRKKLDKSSKVERFIYDIIGDYIWDINGSVCEDPDYQLGYYWDGHVSDYAEELQEQIDNAKYVIINSFVKYLRNKSEIDNFSLDEIDDESLEFFNEIGAPELCNNSIKWQDKLSINQVKQLNKILVKARFETLVVQV